MTEKSELQNTGQNEVTVFWNISETGVNGGYVDTEQVRYYIVRKPENVVVAYANEGTTFTETIDLNGRKVTDELSQVANARGTNPLSGGFSYV